MSTRRTECYNKNQLRHGMLDGKVRLFIFLKRNYEGFYCCKTKGLCALYHQRYTRKKNKGSVFAIYQRKGDK